MIKTVKGLVKRGKNQVFSIGVAQTLYHVSETSKIKSKWLTPAKKRATDHRLDDKI